MICTYIFEDSWRNTLADAVNIKNPKVYIEMKPILGTCMWEIRECKRFKHKGETFEQTIAYSPAVRLVGAVLSAHDEVLASSAMLVSLVYGQKNHIFVFQKNPSLPPRKSSDNIL